MKTKLAVVMVLILFFQVSLCSLNVNLLEDSHSEISSSINSPQGVNSTVFISMSTNSGGTILPTNQQGTLSNTFTFGDGLFVVTDNGGSIPGARMFGGNTFCVSACYNQALYIVNYSSNTLVGIIGIDDAAFSTTGVAEKLLFDTYGDTLHVIPKGSFTNFVDLTFKVEWPIGSTIRNYTGGNIIFDSLGNKVNNNTMIYNLNNQNGPNHEWVGGGYFKNPSLAFNTSPSFYCKVKSITASSENSSIITRICQFSGGNAGSNYTFNFTNSSTLPNFTMNETNGGQAIVLLIEKYTGSTIDWTNVKIFTDSSISVGSCV